MPLQTFLCELPFFCQSSFLVCGMNNIFEELNDALRFSSCFTPMILMPNPTKKTKISFPLRLESWQISQSPTVLFCPSSSSLFSYPFLNPLSDIYSVATNSIRVVGSLTKSVPVLLFLRVLRRVFWVPAHIYIQHTSPNWNIKQIHIWFAPILKMRTNPIYCLYLSSLKNLFCAVSLLWREKGGKEAQRKRIGSAPQNTRYYKNKWKTKEAPYNSVK